MQLRALWGRGPIYGAKDFILHPGNNLLSKKYTPDFTAFF